ncbi:envelope glycoprotein D [Beluga whale alphaherpesvirus 1]|uniref:Envelope glycoprotein D n=1 Tax=Beluga whale alphaherpesvirus 1 TaxID=1434720 RepID=A0A286MM85_9ALPH|nr:envelope glycoprotein D [Beluga whale alphaherpesvirus 1]ASW27111.1 envelope glycoprotein D [Beluga whale alphaherpesvirus 1]
MRTEWLSTWLAACGALLAAPTPSPRTTVYVEPPPYPSPRYPYTVLWHERGPIPSAFPSDPARQVEVFHVTGPGGCGMVALVSDAQVSRLLWDAAPHPAKYRASVSWFYVTSECARPIYTIEYVDCDPRRTFGYCASRTPAFWSDVYSAFSYPTADELGLVLAAPPQRLAGTYRRRVSVNDRDIFTDFMVVLPGEACWFSQPLDDAKAHYGACYTNAEFERGIDRMTYMAPYYQQEALSVMVRYWYEQHGGVVPERFEAAKRYEVPPADPGERPAEGGATVAPGPGRDDVSEPAPAPAAEPPRRGPEEPPRRPPAGWPSFDADTPATAPPPPSRAKVYGIAGGVVAAFLLTGLLTFGVVYWWHHARGSTTRIGKPRPTRFKNVPYRALPS